MFLRFERGRANRARRVRTIKFFTRMSRASHLFFLHVQYSKDVPPVRARLTAAQAEARRAVPAGRAARPSPRAARGAALETAQTQTVPHSRRIPRHAHVPNIDALGTAGARSD